jgi:hypothetical protein
MPAAKAKKKTAKARKPAKKAPKKAPAKKAAAPKAQKPIGEVVHFFDKISVAVVKLSAPLKQGDKIRIEGHGQSFTQAVTSMQIEYEKILAAKKGQEVGMKVSKPVKEGDLVFVA